MEINLNREGGTLTVALEGRLDSITSQQLEAKLRTEIDDVTELIFDLSGLEYVSSAGLRVLLAAQKVMNHQGSMSVRSITPEVMEIFDITGFMDLLNIEE